MTTRILVLGVALSSCASSTPGNFTAADFQQKTYRTAAFVSDIEERRDLRPLEPELRDATREEMEVQLGLLGYRLVASDAADIWLVAGRAKAERGGALVLQAYDPETRRIIWQRAHKEASHSAGGVEMKTIRRLMAGLPRSSPRPVAY